MSELTSIPHDVERPLIIPQPIVNTRPSLPAPFESVALRQRSPSNPVIESDKTAVYIKSSSPSHSPVSRRDQSPLRHKSPASLVNTSIDHDELRSSARLTRQSNKELRDQYYRQINLCKKSSLNYYETSTFVGFLLDIIYMSRKLEELKIRLIQSSDHFNLYDAWMLVEPRAYTGSPGRISAVDLRDSLLRHLVKAEKVSMDRLTLLFNRYNLSRDGKLTF